MTEISASGPIKTARWVLIDYQKEYSHIRSETKADLAELMSASWPGPPRRSTCRRAVHRWPSRPASMGRPSRRSSRASGVQVIDRTTMNAFEDRAFREP